MASAGGIPTTPVPKRSESRVSTFDADPLLVVAYVIFAFGALLLFAAALRLGYWCIKNRSRKKQLDWMLSNSSNGSMTNVYCGRGIKSRRNDYSISDNNSLKIRMEDMFGKPTDTKGNKQDMYAVVKKKKDSNHPSILGSDKGSQNRPEDFWHIQASEIPDNEGSITNLAGSSMRLYRDVPLARVLREDETKSASGYSDIDTDIDTVLKEQGDDERVISNISDNVTESTRQDDKETAVLNDVDRDSIQLTESSRLSIVSDSVFVDKSDTVSQVESIMSELHPDIVFLPGPVQIPQGLTLISGGGRLMTLDEIRAESINPGSFLSLQAAWQMREAQIQSGLDAPMLTPTVGLNHIDDEHGPTQNTPAPPSIREEPKMKQKYANPEEGRMFSFQSSKGKLASMMGSPVEHDNTATRNVKVGKFASGVGVAAVDQIYMDPQEITEKETDSGPVFSIPPPPPLPDDDKDSEQEEEVDGAESTGKNSHENEPSGNSRRTSEISDTHSHGISNNSDPSVNYKRLRFNEEVEEIQRTSVLEDDVSEVSSVPINNEFSGMDGEDDSNSMIENDDVDSEVDNETVERRTSVSDRPPTPVPERKGNLKIDEEIGQRL